MLTCLSSDDFIAAQSSEQIDALWGIRDQAVEGAPSFDPMAVSQEELETIRRKCDISGLFTAEWSDSESSDDEHTN